VIDGAESLNNSKHSNNSNDKANAFKEKLKKVVKERAISPPSLQSSLEVKKEDL
jgi:hypothetical protein